MTEPATLTDLYARLAALEADLLSAVARIAELEARTAPPAYEFTASAEGDTGSPATMHPWDPR